MAAKSSVKVTKTGDTKEFLKLARQMNKEANFVNVGVPQGAKENDGTSLAMIAAINEFGMPSMNIPERSFLRASITRNEKLYVLLNRQNLKKILKGGMTMVQALGQLGEFAKGHIQDYIANADFKPLAAATLQRRSKLGFSGTRPLIQTGNLRQSITWEFAGKQKGTKV